MEAWYDPDIDEVTTPDGFRETIRLSGVNFYEDGKADMCYGDGGLLGGHGLSVKVGPGGVEHGPDMFG